MDGLILSGSGIEVYRLISLSDIYTWSADELLGLSDEGFVEGLVPGLLLSAELLAQRLNGQTNRMGERME
jgi:hypothetical protein